MFSCCCLLAAAQSVITGKVVNQATQEPIAGASVFISNTSRGTVSDKNGNFELRDISQGKYDLVISSIGFETNVFSFSSSELPLTLMVELRVKVRVLDNVTVEPSLEEGWDKWGKTFRDAFIGVTPSADDCKIRNEKSIRFRFFRKSNRLIAYSDEPIIIENRALGYRIKYQLENFEINFKVGSSAYAGFPLFEDMDGDRKEVRRRWRNARDKAYYGSIMHFVRALYEDKLLAEGFEVRRMVRTPNYEKERVRQLYRSGLIKSSGGTISFRNGRDVSTPLKVEGSTPDSSAYYDRVLHQNDNIDTYGTDILTADSIIYAVQPGYKELFFLNHLSIVYKNEKEDPAYLEYHREKRSPYFQRSLIWLVGETAIAIYPDGSYFPPEEIFSSAYWGWSEKMAEMLPLDFWPFEKIPALK